MFGSNAGDSESHEKLVLCVGDRACVVISLKDLFNLYDNYS